MTLLYPLVSQWNINPTLGALSDIIYPAEDECVVSAKVKQSQINVIIF